MYARVIIDISHSEIDKIFEYSVPDGCGAVFAGSRVLVPFGRGDKPIEGYVIALCEETAYDPAKVKKITKALDSRPVLNEDQLELAAFMREKYNCNLVDALRVMLPAQLRGGGIREKRVRTFRVNEEIPYEQAAQILKRAEKQREVYEFVRALGCEVAAADVYEQLAQSQGAAAALVKRGLFETFEREVYRRPFKKPPVKREIPTLTDEQSAVLKRISQSLGQGSRGFLLHGVTGSGKTEVYMSAISMCMERGECAIMLVPEISLTPQTVERFRSRFGSSVAVLHSRLSSGERYDEWRRILRGEASIAIGARSAVFAPFERIGLIIIDEEHESSYKSDKTPKYDAFTIAKTRSEQHGALLLLGSATPCVETYFMARQGELELLEMTQRVNDRPLPRVDVVDMRVELEQGNRSIFSVPLYRRIRECMRDKLQMILFVNRRGYSTFISCRGCGYVFKCPHCDVSLTWHKFDGRLRCHYCGFERELPEVCPECGKPYIKQFGVGTQMVEENALKYFPAMRTIRMDHDTTQTKDAHEKLLSEFAAHEADALIGTQMIAKGLDFPEVVLVGVIAADSSLFVPDFRSPERTFQLLTQVAGRAGRDQTPGRVIVQTYSPEHPSIVFASAHDYKSFYEYEIEERRRNEFPPFADFVRFLFEDDDAEKIRLLSEAFRDELQSAIDTAVANESVDGDCLIYIAASDAPLAYIREKQRRQVILKLRRDESGAAIMRIINVFARKKRDVGVMFNMEVNPQSMM